MRQPKKIESTTRKKSPGRKPKKIESPDKNIESTSQADTEIITEKQVKSAPSKSTADETGSREFNIELQYAGRSIPFSEILGKAVENCGNKKTDLYIKPEENRVYYVSGDTVGSFEI